MNSEKKRPVLIRAELVLLLAVAAVLLLLTVNLVAQGTVRKTESVKALEEGWFIMREGERTDVTLPLETQAEDGQILILYNDSLTAEDAGLVITTRAAVYRLRILMGGKVLYEYEDPYFPRNRQMRSKLSCEAQLPVNTKDQLLVMEYTADGTGSMEIAPVYIGSARAVFENKNRSNAPVMAIVFCMALFGLAALGCACYLRYVGLKDSRFFHVACFLLICSTWCVLDSPEAQVYSASPPVVGVLSFYAFMLLAVPMLYFVKNTGDMKRCRILDLCIIAFYVNALIQGLLHYFCGIAFIRMLFVTHLLLLASIAVAAVLMIREYRQKPCREMKTILLAFGMVTASGVLALALYWIFEIPFYGVIFQLGILIFVLLILFGIVVTMGENIRFRTEMLAYQRLAREDRLTGMKNRLAYDEYMEGIQRQMTELENVALVYLDLNKLKSINDSFGHSAGDEVLIAAARCIEKAFAGCGECFRIGGDEFCVILPEPTEKPEEWYDRLEREVGGYNAGSRYRMSLAKGTSYLRTEDGALKTISDWKHEADMKMYEDKGRQKHI